MIQANSLRIGNLVKMPFLGDVNLTVFGLAVKDDMSLFIQAKSGSDSNFFEKPDKYLPIPITEQWLLRLGFIIHQSPPVKAFRKGLHFGFFDDDCFYFQLGKGMDIEIKHIHQLQNLYFALTGKELILNETNKE